MFYNFIAKFPHHPRITTPGGNSTNITIYTTQPSPTPTQTQTNTTTTPPPKKKPTMSNLLATRKVPLMIAAGIFGGILYTTYGGVQQPRPRSTHDNAHDATGGTLSETAQAVAGTGGAPARSGEDMEALRQY
ncbi:hypothetical protein B0I37DRAFT_380997, partial [Chaetomium sp. MPI-CAGE-AT-0009]